MGVSTCRLAMCSPIDGMALSEKSFWLYRFWVLFFLTALSTNRAMKREHVYSKCIRCGWRQRPITVSGPVSFEEYFCKECGDQLLICVDVRNTKDRNKKDNAGHKRKKKTNKKKNKKRESITLAVADLRGTKPAPNGTNIPGQCTRELGLLGESATSLMSAYLCQDEYYSGPLELNQAL